MFEKNIFFSNITVNWFPQITLIISEQSQMFLKRLGLFKNVFDLMTSKSLN